MFSQAHHFNYQMNELSNLLSFTNRRRREYCKLPPLTLLTLKHYCYGKLFFYHWRIYMRLRNDGLLFSRVSPTSRGERATLALVRMVDGVIIKVPYGVDILYINQSCIWYFPTGLAKIKSESLDKLGTLVVAAIDVNAYSFFLAYLDLACYIEET